MELLKQLDSKTGLFFCEGCQTSVEKNIYVGKRTSSCSRTCTEKAKRTQSLNRVFEKYSIPKSKHESYLGLLDLPNVIHNAFKSMHDRCYSGRAKFKTYEAKGIIVCDEWNRDINEDAYMDYGVWALDAGLLLDNSHIEAYRDKPSVDRIANDGNYTPSNCQVLTQGTNSSKDSVKEVHAYSATTGLYHDSYISLTEAARKHKVSVGHVSEVLDPNSSRNVSGGFIFSTELLDSIALPKNTKISGIDIEVIDIGTNEQLAVFKSVKEISQEYGIPSTNISKVLNGKRKSAKGMRFVYLYPDA